MTRSPAVWARLVFVLLFCGVAAPPVRGEDPMKVTEIEGISEYSLANGTRVLLFPDPSKSVVTVNMTVFVGSRHEGYGEAGMAHLLEHMLFKGTPTHPNVPKLLSEKAGPGNFNGTTWVDRTNYYETLPASEESLEFAIRFEADRLVNSFVRGEDLASEMTVVRNEFERGENDPFSVMLQRMTAAAFEWHNYGKNTIGNRSDIERVPIVRLRNFYRKFYRPDNVMLIIAGKFDEQSALDLSNKYFGAIPQPESPIDDTYTTEPPQDGERQVVLRRVGNTQLVGALYHVPSGSHPDFAAVRALSGILGAEGSGRLYKSMVETELASSAFAFARAYHDPGVITAMAQLSDDASIDDAKDALLQTIEKGFLETPVTEEELDRAKTAILKQRELEANSTDRIAVSLSNWASQGDWRLYFLFRDMVEALTVDHVQEVAEKYFVRNNRTVGMFIPSDASQRIDIPESPDLNKILADYKGRQSVSQGEAFDPTPANIENRTERGQLTDGIKFALLPKKTRGETVQMLLTLRYGTLETLRGKAGAAEFLPGLLQRGTEDLSFVQLQDELDRLRAQLSLGGTPGLLQVSLKTQREYLPKVLDLVEQILRRPALSEKELDVLKRQAISGVERTLNDPQTLASVNARRKFAPYAKDDIRYEPTPEEQLAMIDSVTVEEVRDLYEDLLSSQAGELAVVGDFESAMVKSRVKEMLAGWESKISYVRIPRPAAKGVLGEMLTIETPDKDNAVYFAMQQYVVNDAHEDYPELILGNYVLGGGSLSSRLGDRVRQQDGLSYGVGSVVNASARDERTDMLIFAITNPGNMDRVVAAIDEEVKRLTKFGLTAEELARAKEGYLQQQLVSRTDDRRLATLLVSTMFNNRTMEFYAEQDAAVASATLAEVNEVVAKYIDMDNFVISAAGDFKKSE